MAPQAAALARAARPRRPRLDRRRRRAGSGAAFLRGVHACIGFSGGGGGGGVGGGARAPVPPATSSPPPIPCERLQRVLQSAGLGRRPLPPAWHPRFRVASASIVAAIARGLSLHASGDGVSAGRNTSASIIGATVVIGIIGRSANGFTGERVTCRQSASGDDPKGDTGSSRPNSNDARCPRRTRWIAPRAGYRAQAVIPAIRMQEELAAEAADEEEPAPRRRFRSPRLGAFFHDKLAYGNMAGGAMLTDIFNEGLKRLDDESYANLDGRGWGTSTEPKNRYRMEDLAKQQNPILGLDPLSIVNEETMPETIVRRAPRLPRCVPRRPARPVASNEPASGRGGCSVTPRSSTAASRWPASSGTSSRRTASTSAEHPGPGARHRPDGQPAGDQLGEISAAGSPADQWDAPPTAAKVQILASSASSRCTARRASRSSSTARSTTSAAASPATTRRSRTASRTRWLDLWDVRLHQEALRGAQAGADRRGEQRPPRDDRHLLAHLGVQGRCPRSTRSTCRTPARSAPFTAADASLPFVDSMMGFVGNLGYPL